jgi:arsenite oxidase small subunit
LKFTRRSVLKVIVALTGSAIVVPFIPYGQYLSFQEKLKPVRMKIANISDLKPYSSITFEWPTQTHPYHTNLLIRGKEGHGMGTKGDLFAFNRVCTHLQCLLNYDPKTNQMTCPCHGSIFSADDGVKVSGPAPRPLPTVKVEEDENGDIYAVDIVGEIGYGR